MLLSLLKLFWVLHVVIGNSSDQHLVCKLVTEVFQSTDSQSETDSTSSNCNNIARTGKKGPRGLQGLPGPPGVVDYERINLKLHEELREIKDQLKCQGGVVFGRICYRLPRRVGIKVSYDEALRMCVYHGGILVEIPTEEVYSAVLVYIKKTFSIDIDNKDRDFMRIWLASNYQDEHVILRDGRHGFTSWYPTYPTSRQGHNFVGIHIPIKPDHPGTFEGMFNINRDYTGDIFALCQFSLD